MRGRTEAIETCNFASKPTSASKASEVRGRTEAIETFVIGTNYTLGDKASEVRGRTEAIETRRFHLLFRGRWRPQRCVAEPRPLKRAREEEGL